MKKSNFNNRKNVQALKASTFAKSRNCDEVNFNWGG